MKLQHLTVIFIIIVLPLTLILSAYTGKQIETLTLQNQYDTALIDAAYDSINAFEMNESYNEYSTVEDTLREDVNAAVSTFMQSLSMSMGIGGYKKEQMNTFIPALLFTLYDGYYIYSSTETQKYNQVTNEYETSYDFMLKPYNYYTVRYVRDSENDVVINYTLDNYIVVYGWINGKYYAKSGYLVTNDRSSQVKEENNLTKFMPHYINLGPSQVVDLDMINVTSDEYIKNFDTFKEVTGKESRTDALYNENAYVDPKSAKKYYEDALVFTGWVQDNLEWVKPNLAVRNNEKLSDRYAEFNDTKAIFATLDTGDNDPEKSTSYFAQHKTAVIKSSIQDNLNQAIAAFSKGPFSSYDYKMPQLKETEWDIVSSNICMLAFMQGVPMGTKYYNNYVLVKSTTNKLYTAPDSLYYIDANGDDIYYHKVDCPELGKNSSNIIGYSNFEFLLKRIKDSSEDGETFKYYNRISKNSLEAYRPCYHCIVEGTYAPKAWDGPGEKISDNVKNAYYTAIARERYNKYTETNVINQEE